MGILLKNYWNTEFEYFLNKVNFQSDQTLENPDNNTLQDDGDPYAIQKGYLTGIRVTAQLDFIDNVLLPQDGILIKGQYENSIAELGASQNYEFYKAQGTVYKTFHHNTYGISGYYHWDVNNTPRYMTTIFEGSQVFSGAKEFQMHGSSLTFLRLDYRHKYKKDVFIHFMANWLMNAKSEDYNHRAEDIWGFGTGITILSPVGPLKLIWGWGPKNIYINDNQQNIYHFSAGFKF
jgi:outer membrane protein assembly factor BamA